MSDTENCQVCRAPLGAAGRIMILELVIRSVIRMAKEEEKYGSKTGKSWASAEKMMQQVLDGGPVDG